MSVLTAASPMLVFLALASGGIWFGGFVAIAVVTTVARGQLEPSDQVSFFRTLGRSYGVIGGVALVVALLSGGILLAGRPWDGMALAAVLVAAALIGATAAGVVQARGMTRLRERAVSGARDAELDARVRRGAIRAAALRATIGALSIALLAVVAALSA